MTATTRKGRPNAPARLITDDHGTGRCMACGQSIRHRAFGLRTCGNPECDRAVALWLVSHSDRARQARRERLAGRRRCKECGETKPLDVDHFQSLGNGYYRRVCWECWRPHLRANHERWRATLPARPEQHLKNRQSERIRRRLQAERKGQPMGAGRAALGAWRDPKGGHHDQHLDPRPLREWLEAVIAAESQDEDFEFEHFCRTLGMRDRQVRGIRNGEFATVSLHVADRLLTGYGRPVVIGNRCVCRLEDLWEELNE